jgi:hypothetical protein
MQRVGNHQGIVSFMGIPALLTHRTHVEHLGGNREDLIRFIPSGLMQIHNL